MKLTHNCPTCNKIAKIQTEFNIGNLVNYVYQCGHIELRSKLNSIEEKSIAISLIEVSSNRKTIGFPKTRKPKVEISPLVRENRRIYGKRGL